MNVAFVFAPATPIKVCVQLAAPNRGAHNLTPDRDNTPFLDETRNYFASVPPAYPPQILNDEVVGARSSARVAFPAEDKKNYIRRKVGRGIDTYLVESGWYLQAMMTHVGEELTLKGHEIGRQENTRAVARPS